MFTWLFWRSWSLPVEEDNMKFGKSLQKTRKAPSSEQPLQTPDSRALCNRQFLCATQQDEQWYSESNYVLSILCLEKERETTVQWLLCMLPTGHISIKKICRQLFYFKVIQKQVNGSTRNANLLQIHEFTNYYTLDWSLIGQIILIIFLLWQLYRCL